MQFSIFDRPIPTNYEELEQALIIVDFYLDESSAVVSYDDGDDSGFKGWFAEITDEGKDDTFVLAGYTYAEALRRDLLLAGIDQIRFESDGNL